MKHLFGIFAPAVASAFVLAALPQLLPAQIANPIEVHVNHSFVIGNTTLPPGQYTFRMKQGTSLSVMSVTNDSNGTEEEFLVRDTVDDHTPGHSEVVFKKYGNMDFLNKIFQGGVKTGVEVL